MKNKPTLIIILFILLLNNGQTIAQNWSRSTLSFSADTMGQLGSKCAYDNYGNSFWLSSYREYVNFNSGQWIYKANSTGTTIAQTYFNLNSALWTISGVRDMIVIGTDLYVMLDATYNNAPNDYDIFVQKYNSSLVKQWEVFFNGSVANPNDNGKKIIAGPNSSVLLCGTTADDVFIHKMSRASGSSMNTAFYSNGTGKEDISKILVNGQSIFIGGVDNGTGGPGSATGNMYVAKYDQNLLQKWNTVYDASVSSHFDNLHDMALDTAGNLIVGGIFYNALSAYKAFFAKFSKSTGNRQWAVRMSNNQTGVAGVDVDINNNPISIVGGTPCRFVKLDNATGTLLLNKAIFNGTGINNYQPIKVVKGGGSNLYVMANYDSSYFDGTFFQYTTGVYITKFSGSGGRLWDHGFTSFRPDYTIDPGDMQVKGNNLVYYFMNADDISLIPREYFCYYGALSGTTGLKTTEDNLLVDSFTFSLYPNPAHQRVNLQISSSNQTDALITIYSVTGRQIQQESIEVSEGMNQRELNISALQTGIYIIQLSTEDKSIVQKLVIE